MYIFSWTKVLRYKMWRKKKTLQISWHLQTLASASLFTSRLSRNVTAVFPFFFFLFFSFLFFCRITKRVFALYRYTVLCILSSPCWWRSDNSVNREEKEQIPLFTKHMQGAGQKRVNSMSGLLVTGDAVVLLTFLSDILMNCGASKPRSPRSRSF